MGGSQFEVYMLSDIGPSERPKQAHRMPLRAFDRLVESSGVQAAGAVRCVCKRSQIPNQSLPTKFSRSRAMHVESCHAPLCRPSLDGTKGTAATEK